MRKPPDSRHRLAELRPVQLGTVGPSGGDPGPPVPERPAAVGFGVPALPGLPGRPDPGRPAVTGGWTPPWDGEDVGQADGPTAVEPAVDEPAVDELKADELESEEPGPEEPARRARQVRPSRHHPWGRLAQQWVPEPLRGSRVDPGRRGALLLTLVAAVAALVAAVGVWRNQPEPRPVQSLSLAQVTDSPTSTGHGTSGRASGGAVAGRAAASLPGPAAVGSASRGIAPPTSSPGVIVVSVTGAVRRPGLVRLAPGSRVADAIDKAGGATSAADLTGLNLAAKLSDGASVVVSDTAGADSGVGSTMFNSDGSSAGGSAVGPSAPASTPAAGKVDLNTADVAGLDALPGVGPVTAAGIVAWREKNGRFTSVQQLQEIPGIGPAKFAALAPLVTV